MAFLEVKNLSFRYPSAADFALKDIDFQIEEGETLIVCGLSGSGKSTLLRCLKPSLAPFAQEKSGKVIVMGRDAESFSPREQASAMGFVMQNPDNQLVTHKVWHEMAFTMENLGLPSSEMRLKTGEMCSYFGLGELYERDINSLSGGQKQLVSLASVLAADPSVIILDEPVSQLDPVSSLDFLGMIKRINQELGITVVISEHQLEKVLPFGSKLLVLENGKQLFFGSVKEGIAAVAEKSPRLFKSMPQGVRLYHALTEGEDYPLDVRQSRDFLKGFAQQRKNAGEKGGKDIDKDIKDIDTGAKSWKTQVNSFHIGAGGLLKGESSNKKEDKGKKEKENKGDKSNKENKDKAKDRKKNKPALRAEGLWFRYEKDGRDVLKNLSFEAAKGEIFSVLGANGSGKSTLLRCICGIEKPVRGRICFDNNIQAKAEEKKRQRKLRDCEKAEEGCCVALLPQNPAMLFLKESVLQELSCCLNRSFPGWEKVESPKKREREKKLWEAIEFFELEKLLDKHPYDLSGGEQQRLGLAMLMLKNPGIILLDEPTKGIDFSFKEKLIGTLKALASMGKTVIVATHDIEFAAGCSQSCAMLFNGSLLSQGSPREFFGGNRFYTTEISKISRGIIPGAVFPEDVLDFFGKKTAGESAEGSAGKTGAEL